MCSEWRCNRSLSLSNFLAPAANWNQFIPVKMFPACNTEKIGKVQVDYEPLF